MNIFKSIMCFLVINLFLSCKNNADIVPIVQEGTRNLPDLNNGSITTDSLVCRIKSKSLIVVSNLMKPILISSELEPILQVGVSIQ